MNKDTFNKLSVDEQIKYINCILSEGASLTKVCQSIGIPRSTLRGRFERVGYKYDNSLKIYKSIIEIIEEDKHEIEKNDYTPEEKELDITFTIESTLPGGTHDSMKLLNILDTYEENLIKLNKVYEWYLKSSNDENVLTINKLEIEDFNEEVLSRSFKIYKSVQKDFTNFCKKNKKYKVQDILSQALIEFMNKYDL